MNSFNLKEIFAKTFGYAPIEPLDIEVKDKDVMNKRNADTQEWGPYYGSDGDSGREVFMPVILGDITFPYAWLSVSNSKTIVETPLTEIPGGEVNEEINIQPVRFSMKGLLIGKNGMFPEKELVQLIGLINRREAVKVKSVLTDMHLLNTVHKTDKVIIMDYSLADNPGVKNVRGFTLELKSDREFELVIE